MARTSFAPSSTPTPDDASISASSTLASNSDTTTAIVDSSATSGPDSTDGPPKSAYRKKQRRVRIELPPSRTRKPQQRYWNEYDDGDESSDYGPYTILVYPSESPDFPGSETVTRLAAVIYESACRSTNKVLLWLGADPVLTEEQRPLNSSFYPAGHSVSAESIAECGWADTRRHSTSIYNTFPRNEVISKAPPSPTRDRLIARAYVSCLAVSILILGISFTLALTGRHRLRVPVEIGVVMGVILSLSFAIVAMGLFLVQSQQPGVVQRVLVFVAFCAACGGNGVLLAFEGGGG
ncbi:MAG: hypothetical protein M1829_004340 [Trizodia sp. TS-e1964]|nr:MAG: hypothetical protein M1829_004340 [Trizodia sp. TS-e1964]